MLILDTKLIIPGITYVNIGESHIIIEVIRNIFTEMFCDQYERQESLFILPKLSHLLSYFLLSALIYKSQYNNWISFTKK